MKEGCDGINSTKRHRIALNTDWHSCVDVDVTRKTYVTNSGEIVK